LLQITTRIIHEPGRLIVELPPTYDTAMKVFVEKLRGGPAVIQLKKWYKGRSTGWKSQSHHINGHCQQIAEETGNDFDTVKSYCKNEAISAGYPIDILNDIVIPWSEARIDTLQASILIDTIHRIAAEYGINLKESDP
jgi:hypothetical protein